MATEERLDLCDGKYTVIYDGKGGLRALRHGEPWRDLCGDNLIYWMMARIRELEAEVAAAPTQQPYGQLTAMRHNLLSNLPLELTSSKGCT